jgi:hypothetical protein
MGDGLKVMQGAKVGRNKGLATTWQIRWAHYMENSQKSF